MDVNDYDLDEVPNELNINDDHVGQTRQQDKDYNKKKITTIYLKNGELIVII